MYARFQRTVWGPDVLAVLVLLVGSLVWHGNVLEGFWRGDDGDHLLFALRHQAWEYFLTVDGLVGFSGANLTPFNPLFYNLNLALFGWAPRLHYLHLLALTCLGVLLSYALLREWLDARHAGVGAALFAMGMPTYWVNQYLMTAHYAFGLVLCCLTIIAYRHRQVRAWRLLGPWLYLAACLAKEIYVPLVLILPLLGRDAGGSRWGLLKGWWPYACVVVFYALVRFAVLGSFVGGYGIVAHDWPARLGQLAAVPTLLWGSGPWGVTALLVAALALAHALVRAPGRIPLALLCAGAVLGPIVALTAFPGVHRADRYLYALWWGISIGLAAALAMLRAQLPAVLRLAAALLLLGATAGQSWQARDAADRHIALTDSLYRAKAGLSSDHFIVPPVSGMAYVSEILDNYGLAYALFHPGLNLGAQVLANDEDAYVHLPPQARLVTFSDDCICMRDISAQLPHLQAQGQAQLASYRAGLRMDVRFGFRRGVVHWQFSGEALAPDQGYFRIVDAEGRMTNIGTRGSLGYSRNRKLRFRVDYVSHQGWKTSSGYFDFDPVAHPEINWHGTTVVPAVAQAR